MTVIILSVIVVIETLLIVVFGGRTLHDAQKKKLRTNTFAIQNVGTGMDIRVYNAGVPDGTKIILYPHHSWECMTWQIIEHDGGSCLLKNLYTEKSFESSAEPTSGISLWQKSLNAKDCQRWVFEKVNDTYRIRLSDTEWYLTAESNEKNANLILLSLTNDNKQLWKLIEQHPVV